MQRRIFIAISAIKTVMKNKFAGRNTHIWSFILGESYKLTWKSTLIQIQISRHFHYLMLVVQSLDLRSRICISYSRLDIWLIYNKIKPIQTLNEIREHDIILLNDRACEPICWTEIYDSFSHSIYTLESDIDMILDYKSNITPKEMYLAVNSFVQ